MSARQKVFFENKNVVLRSIYVGKVAQIGFVSPGESNRRIRLEWGTKKVNSLGQAVSITFSVSLTEKKSVKKFFLHFIVVVVAVVKTTAKERKKYTILLRVSGIWTTLTCFGCLIRFETTFTTLQLPQKILFALNVVKRDSKMIILLLLTRLSLNPCLTQKIQFPSKIFPINENTGFACWSQSYKRN